MTLRYQQQRKRRKILMMRNEKKITLFVGILVMLGFFLRGWYVEYHFKKNGILLKAKTIEWVTKASYGLDLSYSFVYNGKEIIESNAFGKFSGNRKFEYKLFPVMYDPEFKSSQLLIQPSDFKRFGISFPDSLNWVLDYLK